jgi:hypothetical protein
MWVDLKDLKEANPIELSHYAVANKLDQLPAFSWWVLHTLSSCKCILKAMKKQYFRTNQKYGIELPHSVTQTLQIDKETGTTFWRDALEKEMKVVMVAFNILPEGAEHPQDMRRSIVISYLTLKCRMHTVRRKRFFVPAM